MRYSGADLKKNLYLNQETRNVFKGETTEWAGDPFRNCCLLEPE